MSNMPLQEDLSAILRGAIPSKDTPLPRAVRDLVSQYGPAAVINEVLKLHNSNLARARAELERVERIDKELKGSLGVLEVPSASKPIYTGFSGPATSS